MRNLLLLCGILILLFSCSEEVVPPVPDPVSTDSTIFYRGADLSFVPKIEASGYSFMADGQTIDVLPFFAQAGSNLIRIRLWNDPYDEHSALAEVLDLATEAQQLGMDILLDFHYSDSWADPGQQTPPQNWQSISFAQLKDSIQTYTQSVIQAFSDRNIPLAMVQIGNETNSGFLWNDGKVGGAFESNWPNFVELFNAAAQAVRDVQPEAKILAHVAGYDVAPWFFSNMEAQQADYDVLALSYYPFWHGSDFDAFQIAVQSLITQYQKPIFIAETAYPFTFHYNDWTNNLVWSDVTLLDGFPASQAGQKDFLLALKQFLLSLPEEDCLGFCYWAPEFVAYRGNQSTEGSPWENMALFGFDGNPVPGMEVFNVD